MDINELHSLFLEAAETDRRLPAAVRKAKLSAWPDYPLDWHGYGWTQQGEVILRPTSEQISDMDWIVERVIKLDQDDRRIIWAAAHSAAFRQRGPQWTRIKKILGLSDPRIVKRRYQDALVKLWYQL